MHVPIQEWIQCRSLGGLNLFLVLFPALIRRQVFITSSIKLKTLYGVNWSLLMMRYSGCSHWIREQSKGFFLSRNEQVMDREKKCMDLQEDCLEKCDMTATFIF